MNEEFRNEGSGSMFAFVVVLFVLLIIVGCSCTSSY